MNKEQWYNEMRESFQNGADPEELLEKIGLEPDYLFDLLD